MSRVTLDEATLAKLMREPGLVAICDEAGVVRGFFSTTPNRSVYQEVEEPYGKRELDELEAREEKDYDLKEVLARLQERP